ncbi:MAG TPA: hypothetical protein VK177_07360 [Flavobacteriales bacterium]|nr:hypothetical protein [Flavobacteriales bacterium]
MRFIAIGLLTAATLFSCTNVFGQRKNKCTECKDMKEAKAGQFKKGEFFFHWGYNRALFSKSDISFIGPGIDFTLSDVVARDRPTPFGFKEYFVSVTIPQFIGYGGYFFRDNWSISLGTDHMKYVMVADQYSTINGTIEDTPEGHNFAGIYVNKSIKLTPDFLRYEHTNGLNYVNTTLEHYSVLWDAKKGPCKLTVVQGLSLAVLYPRSDVDIFNVEGTNVFHVAGWGAALHAGLRFNILKNLFVLWNNKGGYIHLPDVLCEINKYKAKQYFFFYETSLSLGYNWRF